MTIGPVKTEININTILGVVSFLVMFSSIIWFASTLKHAIAEQDQWRLEHESEHLRLAEDRRSRVAQTDERIRSMSAIVDTRLTSMDDKLGDLTNMSYRTAQNEKSIEELNERLGRMSESTGDRFTTISNGLSSLSTQLALANQVLQRLEMTVQRLQGQEAVPLATIPAPMGAP